MKGTIYTETVVHAAPQAFLAEAPYQLVIVTLEDGTRVTGRIDGERVKIDDPVERVEHRNGVPYFRRFGAPAGTRTTVTNEQRIAPEEPVGI